jgi:putative hydrolase of the HAD superfamily
MGNIQAVTFDVGGTLIEPWPSVGHVYAQVAARHGVKNASAKLLEARFRSAFRARKNLNDTRAGWESLVDEVFRGLADEPPSATFFEELYDRFAQAAAWRVFDDVRPTLTALAARGIRLAVVSNWDERLRPLLHVLDLANHFEVIVVSCEVGCAKPAPGIFAAAATRLGLPAGSILHVGDSLELDVEGARAAGMSAVQVLRDNAQPPAAGRIASLNAIPALL